MFFKSLVRVEPGIESGARAGEERRIARAE